MSTTRQLQITLPVELVELVERKIATGAYASESEVVAEGLLTLEARDDGIEGWLARDVAPTYDKMMADPDRGLSVAQVREEIEAFYQGALASKS